MEDVAAAPAKPVDEAGEGLCPPLIGMCNSCIVKYISLSETSGDSDFSDFYEKEDSFSRRPAEKRASGTVSEGSDDSGSSTNVVFHAQWVISAEDGAAGLKAPDRVVADEQQAAKKAGRKGQGIGDCPAELMGPFASIEAFHTAADAFAKKFFQCSRELHVSSGTIIGFVMEVAILEAGFLFVVVRASHRTSISAAPQRTRGR